MGGTGTITEWDPRGFGFVMMESGKRAYVHRSHCDGEDLVPGEVVSATIVPDAQTPKKWAARSVVRGPYQGEAGIVTDWNEAGGYGFVQLDDGRRAYIHRSVFGGSGALTIGQRLRVRTDPDVRNPGKWCVGSILSSDD